MDMDGVYAWGQVTKETQTAQGHRRSTKEIRASVRIAGSRRGQPRAQGLQITQSGCCHRHLLRAQGTPEAYGKVGNAMRQDNRIFRGNGRGATTQKEPPIFILRLNAEEQL